EKTSQQRVSRAMWGSAVAYEILVSLVSVTLSVTPCGLIIRLTGFPLIPQVHPEKEQCLVLTPPREGWLRMSAQGPV
ncbi:hypothetical protein, partial [Paracoccus nototheniae]